MVNGKRTARHEANNGYSAAHVLANRASQPLVMVQWAERVQQRQRRERAQDSQPGYLVPTTARAAAQHHQQVAKPVTTDAPMTQRQLPLEGVSHAVA